MSLRRTVLAFACAAGALSLASGACAQTPAAAPPAAAPAAYTPIASNPSADIATVLKASGQFTTLLKAVDSSGLTPVLTKPGALTVFAPTDAAFAALPAGALDGLMADPAALQKAVAYHVVNTKLAASAVKGQTAKVPSVAGGEIYVDGTGEGVKVNDATVIQADVQASNGVIHVIDKVIMPGFTPPAPPPEAAPVPPPETKTTTTTSKTTTTKSRKKN
jgi:uncharacterized surface protein with fasciclin (FAS1) repeats